MTLFVYEPLQACFSIVIYIWIRFDSKFETIRFKLDSKTEFELKKIENKMNLNRIRTLKSQKCISLLFY